MSAFDPLHVKVGPGTLYAAPYGTTEPTTLTGAWPAGWVTLGYTDAGSVLALTPTVEDVLVAEEAYPVESEVTAYAGSLTFIMAEDTARNYRFALNAGITGDVVSGTSGSTGDGGTWIEPPDVGAEKKVMLGWDALPKGATSGDSLGRLIVRRTLQVGEIGTPFQKAPNKRVIPVNFRILKPTGAAPIRRLFPADLAA